jgi:hypothetical protein
VTAQATKAAQENLTNSQAAIRKYLQDVQAKLETGNVAEYEQFLKDVEAVKANPQGAPAQNIINAAQPGINARLDEILAMRPELAKYMTPEVRAAFGIDPTKFINTTGTEGLSPLDFYDQGEADRFNRVMGFLGTGGTARMPGKRPSELGTLNVEGLVAANVAEATKRNEAADLEAQATLQRILGGARSRRDAATQAPSLAELAKRARVGLQRPEWIDENIVDPTKFYQAGAVSGNEFDYLSPEDAAAANIAYEELMNPMRVQGGNLYGKPQYTWDEGGYQQAVRDALARKAGVPGGTRGPLPFNPPSPGTVAIETAPMGTIELPWEPIDFYPPNMKPEPNPDDPLGSLFNPNRSRL